MPKKIFLLLSIICLAAIARAQTPDAVYDQYLDFNLARSKNDLTNTIALGEKVVPNVDKLSPKAKIYFYNSLAKAYEDNKQFDKATPYYELVSAAVPDYYVVHRALGYIYLTSADELTKQIKATKDKAVLVQLSAQYKQAALKALPHLEKAQACDPSDETLAIIKRLYTGMGDNAGLRSLNSRLAGLSKNCIDIISE